MPDTHIPDAEKTSGRYGVLIQLVLLPILLFFANWIPRAVGLDEFVTADEYDWLQRSIGFMFGLARQEWAETFQYEHPAVTTLWLGALGMLQTMPDFVRQITVNFDPDLYRRPFDWWLEHETGVTPLQLLVAGRWWVTFTIALVSTITYFPLRRLMGTKLAVVSLLVVAWAPMAVGFSRELQPDGMVASTCFASLAFFLCWLYAGQRQRDLFISGVMMGLAWLTKTPAAFLIPTGALLIGVELFHQSKARAQSGTADGSSVNWRSMLMGYVVWGIVASFTFFALWPAMWVEPFGTFTKMYVRMVEYTGGHTNPNYFWGQVLNDPGPFFYGVAFLFRTTPAVLVGLIAALVAGWRYDTPLDRVNVRKTCMGMLIFALVFTGFMTLFAKKFDRYLIPVFLVLNVVAAVGWVAIAEAVAGRFGFSNAKEPVDKESRKPAAVRSWRYIVQTIVLLLGLVLLHGINTARHYPYYITWFNPLVGGTRLAPKIMFTGWGEGLEIVADWLNDKPDPERIHVISWYADGPVSFYLRGTAISVNTGSRMPWLDVDYVVLYINQIQRFIPTATVVNYFLTETPVFKVERKGLELARVYDMHEILEKLAQEAPPPESISASKSWPDLELTALRTLPSTTIPSALPVELAFEGNIVSSNEYKVSLRLFSDTGTLVAQRDVSVAEQVNVQLYVPPDALPAPYNLLLMVYEKETLEPIRTIEGEDLITLTRLEVVEKESQQLGLAATTQTIPPTHSNLLQIETISVP